MKIKKEEKKEKENRKKGKQNHSQGNFFLMNIFMNFKR